MTRGMTPKFRSARYLPDPVIRSSPVASHHPESAPMPPRTASTPSAVWVVRGGTGGDREAASLREGKAIIGFVETPDLTRCTTVEMIEPLVARAMPQAKPRSVTSWARQLNIFRNRIAVGDLIAMPLKTRRGFVAMGICSILSSGNSFLGCV